MKTKEVASALGANVSPSNLYHFLRAAYGTRVAERILRSHGLSRPANQPRPAVERRDIVGANAWA